MCPAAPVPLPAFVEEDFVAGESNTDAKENFPKYCCRGEKKKIYSEEENA